LNTPFLEETHHSLSSLSVLTLTECNTWKKETKTSTSQSWASLVKLTFHWIESPKCSKLSATATSFTRAIPNKAGKATLRVTSPHHKSCQKLILEPSPKTNLVNRDNETQSFLMFFHNPTPKAPVDSREHHPPHSLPYLESTKTLHHASFSDPKRHSHLPSRAQLKALKFLIHSFPSKIGEQTLSHLTK
jgi:hypothetical protein